MFGTWRPNLSGMRRQIASHCVFRRIRHSKTRCHDDTSKIHSFYTITVKIDMCLVIRDPRCVGCGGGLPRITYFAEFCPRKRDVTTTPRRFPGLTLSPSRLMCVWCVETQAEWDAAVGWLALRFSPNEPSKMRCDDGISKISCFYTIAVEVDMCSVRGDPS